MTSRPRRRCRGESGTLARMSPIRAQVEQIVRQVDARCAQSERQKGEQQGDPVRHIEHLVRRQQRDERQDVLQPLMRAQDLARHAEPKWRAGKFLFDFAQLARFACKAPACVDDDGAPRALPDMQVGIRIAHIVVTAASETRLERHGTLAPSQVGSAIAGHDVVEQSDIFGDRLGDGTVRGSAQDQRAAGIALGTQPREQVVVVGQRGRRSKSV